MMILLAIAGGVLIDAPVRPSPAASPTPIGSTSARPVQYCVEGTVTGSRIVRRDCRTRVEWMQRGYDPLDPRE